MRIFAGLGNPGAKYAEHRHNIGFMAVEAIAEANGFGPWRSRFQSEASEGRLGTEKVLLLKPQTYMNESGRAVAEAVRFYKLEPGDVAVFHDELDLAPGKVRVKTSGGHAGHNGLRSIHRHLGPNYTRVRLGIGHPGDKSKVTSYVLHDFAKADHDWLDPLMHAIGKAAPKLAADDHLGFMNALGLAAPAKPARKNEPPAPKAGPSPAPDPEAPASPFEKLAGLFRRD